MTTTPPAVPLVLLIDEDRELLAMLQGQFEADGFRVMVAEHGERALALTEQTLPHLVVLDLAITGLTGDLVAQRLREYADVPILVLTAIDNPDQKIEALTEYADDYLTKPFVYGELLARVRNLLARAWPKDLLESAYSIDERVTIDFARHCVIVNGEERSLSPKEAQLLHLLVKNRGQTLPNALLLDRLWPEGRGTMNALWEYTRRVREKLGDRSAAPRYIESERGIGYRFRAAA